MGIILFLVDTSASMNQRTNLGTSYLDVAKGAIDTFMKVRMRALRGRVVPYVRTYRVRCVQIFARPPPPRARGSLHCMAPLCFSSIVPGTLLAEVIDTCWCPLTSRRMQ